jgi:hypothetical protein
MPALWFMGGAIGFAEKQLLTRKEVCPFCHKSSENGKTPAAGGGRFCSTT